MLLLFIIIIVTFAFINYRIMETQTNFPRQMLPFSKKTKDWRKKCVLWANQKTFLKYSPVRNTVLHMKINLDLLNGKVHMEDIKSIVNPYHIESDFIPEQIQHYPIINSKLNVLRGEESSRLFDYRVVVTNPDAISEIEKNKSAQLMQSMMALMKQTSLSDDDYNQKLQDLSQYYNYEWQDIREVRANALLNHYVKEYNIPYLFNTGIVDAMCFGEELYQCDIIGGEPVINKINPLKIRIFKSGYSNRVEDADMIILEDYWSPGRVIDSYYDVLSDEDIEYLEKTPDNVGQGVTDEMGSVDPRYGLINRDMVGDIFSSGVSPFITTDGMYAGNVNNSMLPYDMAGNIRVLRLYWKSKRRIFEVKSFNPETGEDEYNFYPEGYKTNKAMGEQAKSLWVNEAWEGTMIGNKIFVNMRPKLVQYSRLSNPSRCHFGIIGSIYNLNDSKPFSLVDMMKPYAYLYDIIHDRLNKLIAKNWGKIIELDLSKTPKGWTVDKWLYFAKTNNIAVIDSFREGTQGSSMGKLAGGLNNATSGVIDASTGEYIQYYINLLEFIKLEMSEVCGISKQREGQISNRETVGGVERSTLQSSHITEWIFTIHEDLKRRVLDCFLETAKIAMRGRSKKFQYILSDQSIQLMNIEGDEFAECDYGLVVDNSEGVQELNQKLDTLAQAGLQNQMISFSSIMKLYTTTSLAQKQRMIEKDEQNMQAQKQQAQQQQMQMNQQTIEAQNQQKEAELKQRDLENQRDNQTKLLIAQYGAQDKENDGIAPEQTPEHKQELLEKMREFNERLNFDKSKLDVEKKKVDNDYQIRRAQSMQTAFKPKK